MRWTGSILTREFSCRISAVQLLQLRQLGLSAFVRFFEHALVFRRSAGADLPDSALEDRTVAHQWMAVVWFRQFEEGSGRAD